MTTQPPNLNWFATAVEKIACRDLGACECQRIPLTRAYCRRSFHTKSSTALRREIVALSGAIDEYAMKENACELEFAELETKLDRAKSKYWWGNSVDTLLVDQLSDYCYGQKVCAHSVRRLINSGVIEIHFESLTPIIFPSAWFQWFNAFVFAFVSVSILLLSVSTFICAAADDLGSLVGAATLLVTAIVVAIWGASGPVWRLIVRSEMQKSLASFVYARPQSASVTSIGKIR